MKKIENMSQEEMINYIYELKIKNLEKYSVIKATKDFMKVIIDEIEETKPLKTKELNKSFLELLKVIYGGLQIIKDDEGVYYD